MASGAGAEPTDDALLGAARAGDEGALEALLVRHQPRVYRFGLKMCRDPEDAADVLQETLLAVARTIADFRGVSSLSTWLYTIARSFCIKKRRKSKFAPQVEESLEELPEPKRQRLGDPRAGPEEELAGREVHEAIDQAIRALEPKYREVLVLRDVEGLSTPEVAEVLGVRVEAVKSRLHRARAAVRKTVAPMLGLPEAARAAPGGCPDALTLLSRRLEGELSAESCAEMERHLEACPRCRGACESLRRTLELCRSSPEPELPDSVKESLRAGIRRVLAEAGRR